MPRITRAILPIAAVAVALIATSAWLAGQGVGYLTAAVVAILTGAAALRRRFLSPEHRPLVFALLALGAGAYFAGRAELRLGRFQARPADIAAEEAASRRTELKRNVDRELADLRVIARRGHTLTRDARANVAALERSLGNTEYRAVIVIHGDTLFGWAGTLHADLAQFTGTSGVVASPFGLTLYVVSDSANIRSIATSLLYTVTPADRIAKGLSQRMPSDEVTEGFQFAPPSDVATPDDLRYLDEGRPLFLARPIVPSAEEVRYRLIERARVRVGIALLIGIIAFLIGVARRAGGARTIVSGTVVVLLCLAIAPLSEFSTRSRLFDPSVYFFAPGRALTANAAALTLTAATLLLFALLAIRRIGRRLPMPAAVLLAALSIGAGPFAIRALSTGIAPPIDGAGANLWLIWNIPLCIAATAILVVGSWAGRRVVDGRQGLPIMTGPVIAVCGAVLAPLTWQAPGQWPNWYSYLWLIAVAALVFARPSRRALRACAIVAGLGAATVVWGSASRRRVELAERDVQGLNGPDSYALTLAQRLATSLEGDELPANPQMLLERYVTSDLASAGYPMALMSWRDSTPIATFGSGPFFVAFDTVGAAAVAAQHVGQVVRVNTRSAAYGVSVIAVPMRGGAVTIMLAPRTRLIGSDPYARWYGLAATENNEPPYSVQVINIPVTPRPVMRWRRDGTEIHGDWPLGQNARAHVEVDLRWLDTLIPRGGLLVIADIIAVGVVWLLAAVADGRMGRWLRLRRRQIRSYRARLSVALFLFFLVPAVAFAVWSWRQLYSDAQSARRLLVSETMRAFAGNPNLAESLRSEARRLDTKLLLYRSGVLVGANDSLFASFSPMGTLMRPDVAISLNVSDEFSATRPEQLENATGMLGYRALPNTGGRFVIAAPARVDDVLLDRRRRDLGVLVLFATALGAGAALWLSALAARQLARPIGELREAARAVARGAADVPLPRASAGEFTPVFTAFRAMARDLANSREELARAQRVLAWGEMARQVAHEIKNPLTPIRLGVQHLLRARGRENFDAILEQNVSRILGEIDRLDEIARAFSRYGGAPEQRAPSEPVDVGEIVRDVVTLETLGEGAVAWRSTIADDVPHALANPGELREVLLNIFENARHANARTVSASVARSGENMVQIEIVDDGGGIPADVLPKIFEPHFSTRTSGSGLGLAITRRLIEQWGGDVSISSTPAEGTRVMLRLLRAGAAG